MRVRSQVVYACVRRPRARTTKMDKSLFLTATPHPYKEHRHAWWWEGGGRTIDMIAYIRVIQSVNGSRLSQATNMDFHDQFWEPMYVKTKRRGETRLTHGWLAGCLARMQMYICSSIKGPGVSIKGREASEMRVERELKSWWWGPIWVLIENYIKCYRVGIWEVENRNGVLDSSVYAFKMGVLSSVIAATVCRVRLLGSGGPSEGMGKLLEFRKEVKVSFLCI